MSDRAEKFIQRHKNRSKHTMQESLETWARLPGLPLGLNGSKCKTPGRGMQECSKSLFTRNLTQEIYITCLLP